MAKTKEAAKLSTLQEYRQAISANPKSAEAQSNLGWGLYGEGQWDEAIKAFNDALNLDANQVDALYGLALTRKSAGAKSEAVAAFDKTVALLATQTADPSRSKVLMRLARGHVNLIQSGHWQLSNVLGGEL